MTRTPNLGLPEISDTGAQKAISVNKVLAMLQTLAIGVNGISLTAPPVSPADGDSYVISGTGGTATGAWAGKDRKLTIYHNGWIFFPDVDSTGTDIPMGARQAGMRALDQSTGLGYKWSGSAWTSQVLVATSPPTAFASVTVNGINSALQVFGNDGTAAILIARYTTGSSAPARLVLVKSRSSAIGTFTAVVASDQLAQIQFYGDDGAIFKEAAEIRCVIDGAVSSGVVPGRLGFHTANSSGTLTEGLRQDSSQSLFAGATNKFADSAGTLYLHSYTLATLPTSGLVAGQIVDCTNLANGTSTSTAGGVNGELVCDGTNWRWPAQAGGIETRVTATGAASWTPYVNSPVVLFNTVITGTITFTVGVGTAPIAAYKGMRLRVIRGATATGAFNLNIVNGGGGGGTAKALAAASTWADIEFDGTNWIETSSGTL